MVAPVVWIFFGFLVLLIGIGMAVGAIVWHSRSQPQVWSGGMIALLVIGIFIFFIIAPFIIGWGFLSLYSFNPPLPPSAKTMAPTGRRPALPVVSESVRARVLAEEALNPSAFD